MSSAGSPVSSPPPCSTCPRAAIASSAPARSTPARRWLVLVPNFFAIWREGLGGTSPVDPYLLRAAEGKNEILVAPYESRERDASQCGPRGKCPRPRPACLPAR